MVQSQPVDPDRWVDEHGNVLYGYAMLWLRDPDSASEVVQETFLEALKGRSNFLGHSSERTWLIGILKHRIIDHFRHQARRERGVGGEEAPNLEIGELFDERGAWKVAVRQLAELPERVVERAEFLEIVRACLAELPPSCAEAFTLCEME
jgi:RNA polymerase sigma-70 factor (ECF subfamily)